jgi:hypothetical protein
MCTWGHGRTIGRARTHVRTEECTSRNGAMAHVLDGDGDTVGDLAQLRLLLRHFLPLFLQLPLLLDRLLGYLLRGQLQQTA